MRENLLRLAKELGFHPPSLAASLLCVLAVSIPSAVAAQSETVTVEVSAEIAPRCGFADAGPGETSAPGDLEQAARLSFGIKLDCNTPFSLGVVATNGALVNQDASPDDSGFAFAKTYYLSIGMETDRGITASERCVSTQIVAGGTCSFASTISGEGLSSGQGIAIDRDATFEVEWPDQRELTNRLAPGRYRDTLILVVGART